MRRLILTLAVILSVAIVSASNVTIGILVPDQIEGAGAAPVKLLESRLRSIATSNGVSSDIDGGFVMYPVINVIDKKIAEGGLKSIHLIEVELSLFVKQTSTLNEYGNCTTTLKGSGTSYSDAMRDAISKIKTNNIAYKEFLDDSKDRIIKYFIGNKKALISKANVLSKNQNYEEALLLLASYPASVEGSDEVFEKSVEIYKLYLNREDSKLMNEAKGAYALFQFGKAVSILSKIGVESPQYEASVSLIAAIEADVKKARDDAMQREIEEIQYQRKKETDAAKRAALESDRKHELSQQRIDAFSGAISNIASAWSKRKPNTTTYNQIVK
ncbi:MAG: hypothetical protein SNH79_01080 [Rikenellaceae bacterium]